MQNRRSLRLLRSRTMAPWMVSHRGSNLRRFAMIVRKCFNWPLHMMARFVPGARLRVQLHRWRGVRIGSNVFIGDEVYLENNHPDRIEIGDNVQIGIRTIIMAHL